MNLDELLSSARTQLAAITSSEQLEAFRIKYLGSKGLLKQAAQQLRSIPVADKKTYGQQLNTIKDTVTQEFEALRQRFAGQPSASAAAVDITEPGVLRFDRYQPGSIHLITQTIDRLLALFATMGFAVADGPELEDEYHNFEALNVPPTHPARDPLDNFYLERAAGRPLYMMRSQTSSVQIRVLEKQRPPVRIVAPGRVYRPDTVDATHSCMFHQLEGLVVDRHVTMVDLKTCIDQFAHGFFGGDVQTRFRPSFFPFTEPSAEFDVSFHLANGQVKWMELGGCGMVDPNVLEMAGLDPEEFSGFAFGLGIERIAMRRHNVPDIRAFYENDLRFLRQF